MKSLFKAFVHFGLALSIIVLAGLTPVQLGISSLAMAETSDWSQPVLLRVDGVHFKPGQDEIVGPIEIVLLKDGTTFPVDPLGKFKDKNGDPISLTSFTSPSKVRFRLEKGVVKEMVLIEALPR